MKHLHDSDPTAHAAIKQADRAPGAPRDLALRRAAEARARGDEAGYERFMNVARQSGGGGQ